MNPIEQMWHEMVTVGLLGTDRREPPPSPAGLLADLAADEPRTTPSQRFIQQVAATTVIRRAGVVPGPVAAPFSPPPPDDRPPAPAGTAATWRRIIATWPVLEDEWLLALITSGHRLAPELIAPLLARHRADPTRRARVQLATGGLADWLIGHQPALAPASRQRPSLEAVANLPDLAILPELAEVLAGAPEEVVRRVVGGLSSGAYGVSHRAVLTNFVARVHPVALPALATGLDRIDPSRDAIGLAIALADLARLRHHMLSELEPT